MDYRYGIYQHLSNDLDNISTDKYTNIHICSYSVNTTGKLPFLKYLLVDNGFHSLTLPTLPIYKLFNKDTLLSYSELYLSTILEVTSFEEFKHKIQFNGFYEYNHDLYLFFDITPFFDNETALYNMSIKNFHKTNVTFGIMDEIINRKHVHQIPIDINTTIFFAKNYFLCTLYDSTNSPIEEPVVGYVSKPTFQKAQFTFVFRENAQNKSAILGPFFYFTNYENAISQKEYLVRFALFLGNTKYIEHFPNDPIDDSDIQCQRLQDTSLDLKKERLTLRISDHEGDWSNEYDSVFLGKIELDDGSYLDNTPSYVIKNYNQQIPLSLYNI